MKTAKQNKALSFFVALFFALGNIVTAQAQVVDSQSFLQSVKDTFNQVKESETVVKTIFKVKKMSAAIGTAKKTMSELKTAYETKVKAKMEKIQKYTDKAKEYKKKFDNYKAQLDTAIDKAKDLKDKVEDGIDKAKELKDKVEDGIDKAKDLKDKVQDGIDTVKSKTDSIKDKVGDSTDDAVDENIIEDTKDETPSETTLDAKPTIPEDAKPAVRQPFVEANVDEDTSNEVSAQDSSEENLEQSEENAGEEVNEEDGGEENVDASTQTEQADENTTPVENDGTELLPMNNRLATGLSVKSEVVMTPLKFDAGNQSIVEDKVETSKIKKDIQIKGIDKAVANINKEKPDNKLEDVKAVKSQIVNSGKLNNKIEDVKAINPKKTLQERSSLRKIFKSSSLQYSEKFAFAKIEAMPDGGIDVNDILIVPEKLAMFCNLSSEDAQSGGNMENCLLKLNQERTAPQADSPYDAPTIYNIAMAQYAAASIAEAFKALNDAESFEEKVIEPIDFAEEPTAQDVYSNIVEMNKSVDQQMNGLLKIYSAQLVTKTIKNFGDYIFLPPEEEDENG